MCVYQHFIQIPSGTGGMCSHLCHIRVSYSTGRCAPASLPFASSAASVQPYHLLSFLKMKGCGGTEAYRRI